jgi:hypothetical protein
MSHPFRFLEARRILVDTGPIRNYDAARNKGEFSVSLFVLIPPLALLPREVRVEQVVQTNDRDSI